MPSTMRPTPNILTLRWPSRICWQAGHRRQQGGRRPLTRGADQHGVSTPAQVVPTCGMCPVACHQRARWCLRMACCTPPRPAHLAAADSRLHLLYCQRQLDVKLVLQKGALGADENFVRRRCDVRRVVLSGVGWGWGLRLTLGELLAQRKRPRGRYARCTTRLAMDSKRACRRGKAACHGAADRRSSQQQRQRHPHDVMKLQVGGLQLARNRLGHLWVPTRRDTRKVGCQQTQPEPAGLKSPPGGAALLSTAKANKCDAISAMKNKSHVTHPAAKLWLCDHADKAAGALMPEIVKFQLPNFQHLHINMK